MYGEFDPEDYIENDYVQDVLERVDNEGYSYTKETDLLGTDSLNIILNQEGMRCNFDCDHCGTRAGTGEGRYLQSEDYKDILKNGIGRYEEVVFTGGVEPTLLWNDLAEELVHEADRLGYNTRMVSNIWWANDHESAENWVQDFENAGLDVVTASYDQYHRQDLENITLNGEDAIDIGKRAIQVTENADTDMSFIAVSGNESRQETLDMYKEIASRLDNEYDEYVTFGFRDRGVAAIDVPGYPVRVTLGTVQDQGFGAERLSEEELNFRQLNTNINEFSCPASNTSVYPDGNITPCCGFMEDSTENYSGAKAPDEEVGEAEKRFANDPMIDTIREEGFGNMVRELNSLSPGGEVEQFVSELSHNGEVSLTREEEIEIKKKFVGAAEESYAGTCTACKEFRDIFSV